MKHIENLPSCVVKTSLKQSFKSFEKMQGLLGDAVVWYRNVMTHLWQKRPIQWYRVISESKSAIYYSTRDTQL